MDMGNLRWLDRPSRVVAVVVVAVAVAVVKRAILDVVSCLATLEAGVLPLAVIHKGALVVESFTGISLLPGLIPSVLRC